MSAPRYGLTVSNNVLTLGQRLQTLAGDPLTRRVQQTALKAVNANMQRLIDQRLRVYPPKRHSLPTRWSRNPFKQRRARAWWHFHYQGEEYRRTGALAQAWRGVISIKSRMIELIVFNPAQGASYVYGDVGHSYERPPLHDETGFPRTNVEVAELVLEVTLQADDVLGFVWSEEVARICKGGKV